MALSRSASFTAGSTAVGADVESEFDRIYNNALTLISPLTGALDCDGNVLQNVAAGTVSAPGLYFASDANTGLYRSAADTVDIAAGGVRAARFNTAATAVNFLDVTPSATTAAVEVEAAGSDTNVSLVIDGKGNGVVNLAPAGIILPYGGASAPTGWLLCDGTAVSRTTYARLFSILSTTFGAGDGSTTFNVPDLRGRFPLGADNMGGSSANRVTDAEADTVGSASGSATALVAHTHDLSNHTHTIAHTHTVSVNNSGTSAGNTRAEGSSAAETGTFNTGASSAATSGAPSTNTSGSGGSGTSSMNPYLTLTYIVKW